jgi:hypothetical protein
MVFTKLYQFMKNLLIVVLVTAAFLSGLTTESCKKSAATSNKAFRPSSQDSLRMEELEQEITLRIRELGTLISRTTGCTNCSNIEGFEMKMGNTAAGEQSNVIIINYGNGVYECRKDPPGICCECPCP